MQCSQSRHLAALQLTLAVGLTLCAVGAAGCGSASSSPKASAAKESDDDKKKDDDKEKPKPPFEVGAVTPLLSEALLATDEKGSLRLAKPDHWTTTVQRMTANDDNFEGRTTIAAVDRRDQPLAIAETPFAMVSTRPALLAKGRLKRVLNELLPPPSTRRLRVQSSLASGGSLANERLDLWTLMPSHQYFVVVLAREPARYAYLKVSDTVRAPYEDVDGSATPAHYRVVLADGTKPVPLPTNVLTWTSVAYVVWDEVNLAQVSTEQQQALVDWIHWGGRLVVNGPDSLATLRGSFLDKYLPVDAGKSIEVDADDLAEFSARWAARSDGKEIEPLMVTRPWSGIELTPRPRQGFALPGGEGLFYEGAVGSGSIVVSAVQLTERDLVNWPAFDGFLNGGLLRRAGRQFRDEHEGQVVGLQTVWADAAYADRTRDAHFTTPLRWFARDAGTQANARMVDSTGASLQAGAQPGMNPLMNPGGGMPIPERTLVMDRPGGLGAWNEFGPVSDAARDALRVAAGVRVPSASFVAVCLAVYLIVLVPLNWMMFHALGRIEWAWIAAPVIALAGTIAVVRQAQLDIGFVRSQTEIALFELQGDLPRGNLNRYVALYSSLSTTYDAEFADATAVATPFPAEHGGNSVDLLGTDRSTVEFEKYDEPRLRGVPVTSASTQLIHSEQMFELEGGLLLSSPSNNPHALQLNNKTGLDLADAVVMHRFVRSGKVTYESCWLGEVRNGAAQLLPWTAAYPKRGELPYATERAKAAEVALQKRLDVNGLLKLAFTFPEATDPAYGNRDEYRLVARVDRPLPGAITDPAASQTTGATVVLAHLRCSLPPAPTQDVNSRADVASLVRSAADDVFTSPDAE